MDAACGEGAERATSGSVNCENSMFRTAFDQASDHSKDRIATSDDEAVRGAIRQPRYALRLGDCVGDTPAFAIGDGVLQRYGNNCFTNGGRGQRCAARQGGSEWIDRQTLPGAKKLFDRDAERTGDADGRNNVGNMPPRLKRANKLACHTRPIGKVALSPSVRFAECSYFVVHARNLAGLDL